MMRISNSQFINNTAFQVTGAILIAGSSEVILESLLFQGNMGTNSGCLTLDESANVTILNSQFLYCYSNISGGAISSYGYSICSISHSYFFQNLASSFGSCILCAQFSRITANNSEFMYVYLLDSVTQHNFSFLKNS